MSGLAWLLALCPLLHVVGMDLHHKGDHQLQPALTIASNHEMVEAELLDAPPAPLTSWDYFDMKGTLAGTEYDPFSQVRHLVDDVFRQHEQRLKQSQPVPASSFLEVRSFRRSSASAASASAPPTATTDKPTQQQGSHRSPAASSGSPAVAPAPYRVRYRSPTVLSAPLNSIREGYLFAQLQDEDSHPMVLLELGSKVQKVQSFCEICILIMQMKERGEPHLCAGLNSNYYITCVENLESLLRADKALVYWLKEGCMHLDSEGPEIVRPCPAINICSWVPNLFTPPPTIVRDEVESLCPKDLRFLPTIPEEYRALLGARRL